jgi:hypothetical protein
MIKFKLFGLPRRIKIVRSNICYCHKNRQTKAKKCKPAIKSASQNTLETAAQTQSVINPVKSFLRGHIKCGLTPVASQNRNVKKAKP